MTKNKLHNIFDESECISEKTLLKYVNKELSNIRRNEVEKHAINCKLCSNAIEGFEKYQNSVSSYLKFKKVYQKNTSNLIYYIGAIAASILIIFLLKNTYTNNTINYTASNFKAQNPSKDLKKEQSKQGPIGNHSNSNKASKEDLINNSRKNLKEVKTNQVESKEELIYQKKEGYSSISRNKVDKTNNIIKSKQEPIKKESSNKNKGFVSKEPKPSKENTLTDTKDKLNNKINEYEFDLENDNIVKNEEKIKEIEIQSDKLIILEKKLKNNILDQNLIEKGKDNFQKGKKAYERKDWEIAINQLSEVRKELGDKYYEANYLIGKSYLKLNKKNLAKKHLKISSQTNSEWKIKSEIEINKLK